MRHLGHRGQVKGYFWCHKFEEYRSNIFLDLLYLVLYCFSGTIYDVNTFLVTFVKDGAY